MNTQTLFHLLGFKVKVTKEAFLSFNHLQIPQTLLRNTIRFLVNDDLLDREQPRINFYLSDQDIFLNIERTQKDFIFHNIIGIDISDRTLIRKGKAPSFPLNEPVFFKSSVDDKKIFLNKNVIQELREVSINPQSLTFDLNNLSNGFYSKYDDELQIVTFFYVENKNVLVLKTEAIDYIKTGITYNNTIHLKKLAHF